MPLMHGKSDKAFQHNVKTEMDAHPGRQKQNLAIAYAMKRRNMARGGMVSPHAYGADGKCMAHGGACMAAGGMVEHQMHPHESAQFSDEHMMHVEGADSLHSGSPTMDAAAGPESPMSLVDQIMHKRSASIPRDMPHMAEGGRVSEDWHQDDDIEPIHDYSTLPDGIDDSTTGEAHDADETDENQGDSLVGQIMRKRRRKE